MDRRAGQSRRDDDRSGHGRKKLLRRLLESADSQAKSLALDLELREPFFTDKLDQLFEFFQIHAGLTI
jgi:hypothetical protein